MKTCSKCGEPKELDQFHKNGDRGDGLDIYCKACRSAHQKTVKYKNSPSQRKAWADGMMATLHLDDSEY